MWVSNKKYAEDTKSFNLNVLALERKVELLEAKLSSNVQQKDLNSLKASMVSNERFNKLVKHYQAGLETKKELKLILKDKDNIKIEDAVKEKNAKEEEEKKVKETFGLSVNQINPSPEITQPDLIILEQLNATNKALAEIKMYVTQQASVNKVIEDILMTVNDNNNTLKSLISNLTIWFEKLIADKDTKPAVKKSIESDMSFKPSIPSMPNML